MGWRFCSLTKALDVSRSNFDCGDEEINTYLRDLAVVAEEEGFSKAFLMLSESNQDQIAGFYTLSNSSIPAQELPDEFMKGFIFPCPAILIGQFAIDKSFQNQKLSNQLLWDVYRRIILLYKLDSAFRAIRVDTRNDLAKNFWLRQGFIPFKKRKSSLFLPIQTLVRELEAE